MWRPIRFERSLGQEHFGGQRHFRTEETGDGVGAGLSRTFDYCCKFCNRRRGWLPGRFFSSDCYNRFALLVKVWLVDNVQETEIRKARRHLRAADPVMKAIIDAVGPFLFVLTVIALGMLVRSIHFQQISGSAAASIFKRLRHVG